MSYFHDSPLEKPISMLFGVIFLSDIFLNIFNINLYLHFIVLARPETLFCVETTNPSLSCVEVSKTLGNSSGCWGLQYRTVDRNRNHFKWLKQSWTQRAKLEAILMKTGDAGVQTHFLMKEGRDPRNKFFQWDVFLTKVPRIHKGVMSLYSINSVEKTRSPHTEEEMVILISFYMTSTQGD